jgi:hypothetical protein
VASDALKPSAATGITVTITLLRVRSRLAMSKCRSAVCSPISASNSKSSPDPVREDFSTTARTVKYWFAVLSMDARMVFSAVFS